MANAFVLLNDKNVSSEISQVAWCPSMDLLALATRTNHIHHSYFQCNSLSLNVLLHVWIYRFLTWSRLLTINGDGRSISSIVWHPDGIFSN